MANGLQAQWSPQLAKKVGLLETGEQQEALENWVYEVLGKPDATNRARLALQKLAPKLNSIRLARLHYVLGNTYLIRDLPDSALASYREAIRLTPTTNETAELRARVYMNIGGAYRNKGQFVDALRATLNGLQCINNKRNIHLAANLYINAHNDYTSLEDMANALETARKAYTLARLTNDSVLIAQTLVILADEYSYQLNRHDTALVMYNEAIGLFDRHNQPAYGYVAINNMAYIYEQRGQLQENLRTFQRAIDFVNRHDLEEHRGLALSNLANAYALVNDLPQAMNYFRLAHNIVKKGNDLNVYLQLLQGEADAYAKLGDFQKAYELIKEYTTVHDSVINQVTTQQTQELSERFKASERQAEIELLRQQNLTQEEANARQRTLLIASFLGLALVTVFALVALRLWRLRRRNSEQILAQNNELMLINESARMQQEYLEELTKRLQEAYNILEVDHQRKSRELQDARRLQSAILPQTLPRVPGMRIHAAHRTTTEVGGDYYDFVRSPKGHWTFAVGDATGHGVLAAFVVTTVKSYFQRLALSQPMPLILETVSEAVRSLNVEELYMGLLLARWTPETGRLTFANAALPAPILYRAETGKAELLEHFGFYLGTPISLPYTEREVNLQAGDLLLFLTDGLAEASNADENNLGYERMRVIVEQEAAKGPERVCEALMEAARTWSGRRDFEDDVTLLALQRT